MSRETSLVTADWVAQNLNDPKVVIVEVDEDTTLYAQGHIENAINIDVEGGQFDSGIAELDKTKTYAIYCRSGRRSGAAVAKMSDAGFTSLFNLNAGITDWQSQGYPVVA